MAFQFNERFYILGNTGNLLPVPEGQEEVAIMYHDSDMFAVVFFVNRT